MRLNGITSLLENMEEYKSLENNVLSSTSTSVHGLSESQRALIVYGIFKKVKGQMLILTNNDMEAKKLYNDFIALMDNCYYMPSKEMVFNIEVSSSEIKSQRLEVIRHVVAKEDLIVVASIDSLFYKMPPKQVHNTHSILISKGEQRDIITLMSYLLDLGYERVESVEGKGQFAKRGGLIDLYPAASSFPIRIEFFSDEIDTIRSFDIISQRSIETLESISIHPSKEIILSNEDINRISNTLSSELNTRMKIIKNKNCAGTLKIRVLGNIEKLQNLRGFEGMDSYIPYFYEDEVSFLDYFDVKRIILNETQKLTQKIDSIYYEFSERFKSLLEKGEVLPLQGDYIFSRDEIINKIKENTFVAFNTLPRKDKDFDGLDSIAFEAISLNSVGGIEYILSQIKEKTTKNYNIIIFAGSEARGKRLKDALVSEGIKAEYSEFCNDINKSVVTITSGSLRQGMELPTGKILIISDKEVYKDSKPRRKFTKKEGRVESFTDLKAGDYIVHINHGIGKFEGISELKIEGVQRDFLVLSYKGDDTLYVPVDQLDMVQKYIGSDEKVPKMNKLGGLEWAKTKGKVRESLKDMADELLKLYAQRSTVKGY
ncbi:MAG: CarD family transcriptional regulator, partial [Clostridium sp.]